MAHTQYDRVLKILSAAKRPVTLYQIRDRIQRRWDVLFSDAAISARVRDIRRDLRIERKTVQARPVKGKPYYDYLICPAT